MTKTKYWLSILAISVVLIAGSLVVSPIAIADDDDDDDGATTTVRQNSIAIPENTQQTVKADCLSGEIVTGGGFSHTIPTAFIHISENNQVGNGWQVTGFNEINGDVGEVLTAYVQCLKLG